MIKSLYIGNVEFCFDASCNIQIDERLKEYCSPLMLIKRKVIYHIKHDENPQQVSFRYITKIDYLPHFVGETESGECRFYFDIFNGKPVAMYREINENEVDLIFYQLPPEQWTVTLSDLNYLAIERQMIKAGSLILHSSFIEVNGRAILFTAPSGTGKSTQADMWKKFRRARIINGDRTLLTKKENKFVAVGFPLSGSSNIFENIVLDISAIVMIRQAMECSGKKEDSVQAFKKIYPEITRNYWDAEYEETVIQVLNELLPLITKISLDCTMNEDTVECLEEIIAGENTDENC